MEQARCTTARTLEMSIGKYVSSARFCEKCCCDGTGGREQQWADGLDSVLFCSSLECSAFELFQHL